MQDKESIITYNENGERHGYWEVYSNDKQRYIIRNYVNGVRFGFEEHKSSTKQIFTYYAR